MFGASNNQLSSEQPISLGAPNAFEDLLSQLVLGGRKAAKPSASIPGKWGAVLCLGLIACYPFVSQIFTGSALHKIRAEEEEDELCDAGGLGATSATCAEHHMFKSWQANAAADDILDMESLLREVPPPRSQASDQPAESEASPAESPTGAAAADGGRRGPNAAGLPEEATPAQSRPMMEEVAKAMCEMCMEPNHRDSGTCAQFKGRTSCETAHEEGALTSWATNVEKLQADLRHKVDESREHHKQLEERHPRPPPKEEAHSLLEDIALAVCEMCMEPNHRDSEKCLQYQNVSSCGKAAHAAAVSGQLFTSIAPPTETTETRLELKVNALGCERCADPARRDYPSCQPFLENPECRKHLPAVQVQAKERQQTKFESWTRIDSLASEICKDPARSSLPACRRLLRPKGEAMTSSASVLEGAAEHLQAAQRGVALEEQHLKELQTQHTKWDKDAADRMADLRRQLCSDPARQNYSVCKGVQHKGVRAADLVQAQAEFTEHLHDLQVHHQEWENQATNQMTELWKKLCADPARSGYTACAQLHGATQDQADARFSQRLHELHDQHHDWDERAKEEIETLKAQLCVDPARKHYSVCAHHKETEAEAHAHLNAHLHELQVHHEDWDRQAHSEMATLLKELCADPTRKGYAACAEPPNLRGTAANPTTGAVGPLPHFAEWDSHAADRALDIGRALCEDPARALSAACARLRAAGEARPAASSLRGAKATTLRFPEGGWASSAEPWGVSSLWDRRDGAAVIRPEELPRQAAWLGKVPKVVCVTLVPDGPEAAEWLQTTMETFRAQSYEGPRELRLVYHAGHLDTAHLVRSLADGVFIQGVAAYGEEEFPSAAPFRFGAWKTDADLVARWDIGAWHHPQRLAMQVRAMAAAARPASLLGGGEQPDGSHVGAQEQTLIGEVAWMKKHWFPSIGAPPLLDGPAAQQMVRVDTPELYMPGPAQRA